MAREVVTVYAAEFECAACGQTDEIRTTDRPDEIPRRACPAPGCDGGRWERTGEWSVAEDGLIADGGEPPAADRFEDVIDARVDLREAIQSLERVDWSDVPGLSAAEAAAFGQRLRSSYSTLVEAEADLKDDGQEIRTDGGGVPAVAAPADPGQEKLETLAGADGLLAFAQEAKRVVDAAEAHADTVEQKAIVRTGREAHLELTFSTVGAEETEAGEVPAIMEACRASRSPDAYTTDRGGLTLVLRYGPRAGASLGGVDLRDEGGVEGGEPTDG